MLSLKVKLQDAGVNVDTVASAELELFRKAVAGVAKAAQSEWIRLAQSRLKTSRETYVNGLRQAESFETKLVDGNPVYTLSLVGDMANNIEFGMAPYDMKAVRPGWLGGAKAKTSKDGSKYVVIPFRHSTSSSARLDYSGKAAKADLKKELKATVKSYGLDRMIRTATGQVVTGAVKKVPTNSPVHSYLKGLTKIQSAAAGTNKDGTQRGSSTLITWRIMSENSAPESWQHPGIIAKNLLSEVERFVNKELDQIVKTVLEAT